MHSLKPVLASWACLAHVSFAAVAFTKWPTTVYTGQPATVSWSGDPNAPATITLRKGAAGDLKTLEVLTTQAGGGSFTWVPEESLPDGTDYALQIDQNGRINYSGLITVAHQPGTEPPLVTSKNTQPLPSVGAPLGGMRTGVQKGNNGYVPALNSTASRFNMTSGKSTTSSKSSDGASFRYVAPEIILSSLAAIIYFAA